MTGMSSLHGTKARKRNPINHANMSAIESLFSSNFVVILFVYIWCMALLVSVIASAGLIWLTTGTLKGDHLLTWTFVVFAATSPVFALSKDSK